MDKINALFYDNLGNFQWNSITAVLSVVILILQICQFVYQQIKIKDLKKQDIRAEFRMNNLKELKSALSQFFNLYSNVGFGLKNEIEGDIATKLLLSLNKQNKSFENFRNAFLEINGSAMKGEFTKVKLVGDMQKLTDAYNEYEKEEIKQIYKI